MYINFVLALIISLCWMTGTRKHCFVEDSMTSLRPLWAWDELAKSQNWAEHSDVLSKSGKIYFVFSKVCPSMPCMQDLHTCGRASWPGLALGSRLHVALAATDCALASWRRNSGLGRGAKVRTVAPLSISNDRPDSGNTVHFVAHHSSPGYLPYLSVESLSLADSWS